MRKAASPLRDVPDQPSRPSSAATLRPVTKPPPSGTLDNRSPSRVSIADSNHDDPCPTPPPVRDRRTAPELLHLEQDVAPSARPRRPSPKRNRSSIFSRVLYPKKHQIIYVDPASLSDDYYNDDDTRSLSTSCEEPESPVSPTHLPTRPPPTPSPMPVPSSAASIPQSARGSRPRSPDTIRPGSGTSYESQSSVPTLQTVEAKQILHWMQSTCGRVRGDVFYRARISRSAMSDWAAAYCFIKAEDGSLRYERRSTTLEQDESVGFQTLAEDLYGCQVHIGLSFDGRPAIFIRLRRQNSALDRSGVVINSKKMSLREQNASLRESGAFNSPAAIAAPALYHDIELRPVDETQINYWLAALLCWESILLGRSSLEEVDIDRLLTHTKSSQEDDSHSRDADEMHATIKVGQARLLDGSALGDLGTQRAHHHLPHIVTCALRANGEFTVRRADCQASFLINLTELPRSAICALDPEITGAKYSILVGLSHACSMKASSRVRPLVISFPTKASFESWFCLIQALAAPELHRPDFANFTDDFTLSDNFGSLDPHAYWDYALERQLEVKIANLKIYDQFEPPSPGIKSGPTSAHPIHEFCVGLLVDGHAISRVKTQASATTGDVSSHDRLTLRQIPNDASELSLRVIKQDQATEALGDARPASVITSSTVQDVEFGEAMVCHNSLDTSEDQQSISILINHVGMQVGEVRFSWTYRVNTILPTTAYNDTMKLLRNFENGLPQKLFDRVPCSIAAAHAALYLNVVQCSNLVLPWLKDLITREITKQAQPRKVLRHSKSTRGEVSSSNNTLFRDNTLLTRALDEYMKRMGRAYLEETIGPHLRTVQEQDVDCEIDPGRIDKEAADHNWRYLLLTATEIWTSIAKSAKRCPRELRELFKHAREEALHAFGSASPQVYSSVTAFIFLRFFVPAIMTPHLWDLTSAPANERVARTFKHLSRAINTLANMTEFGVKQQWMMPMDEFIHQNKQSMVDFIIELCKVSTDDIARQPPKDIAMRFMSRQHPTRRNTLPHLPGLATFASSLREIMDWWLSYVETAAGADLTGLDVSTDAFDPSLSKFTRSCRELRAKARDLVRLTPRAPRRESVWAAEWLAQAEAIEDNPAIVWRMSLSGRSSAPPTRGGSAPVSGATSAAQTSRASIRSASDASTERAARASVLSRESSRDKGSKPDKTRDKDKGRDKGKDKGRRKSPARDDPYEHMRRKMGFV